LRSWQAVTPRHFVENREARHFNPNAGADLLFGSEGGAVQVSPGGHKVSFEVKQEPKGKQAANIQPL
jgi:cold shock CspA family protein